MNNKTILILLVFIFFLSNVVLAGWIFVLVKKLKIAPMEIFVMEEYRPADIEVDVSQSLGIMNPFWQSFAQGGEEMGGKMLTSTVGPMKQLSPQYIRLDHIFDDDYYSVVKGSGQYDFERLDKTVDEILAMGARPFFSLGYMPASIADTKISTPRDWNNWFSLVKATVEHYSGRDGKNISNVYYEVWNEPDLESFGSWKRGGEKNYLTLYSTSARAAQAAENANRFYIGGPATTALYKNWVLDLVNFCKSNGLRLDFISWHRYSFWPEVFQQDMRDTYEWLGDERDNYQWLITEWGPTPEKSNTYGSVYASAHAFAVVRRLLEATDGIYAFEVKDGPAQENFGWGLLAHESAGSWKKPRFAAFSWLKDAWGERVRVTGEGSNITGWAVKRDDGAIDLYLSNFSPQSGQKETAPVRFVNIAPGKYELEQQFLLNPKNNIKTNAGTKSGRLFVTFEMGVNEIARIRLKKG